MVSNMAMLFVPDAESALQQTFQRHHGTSAYRKLVSLLRSIETDTSLIAEEAVRLEQFEDPTFLIVWEADPPGPRRILVVFTIDAAGDQLIRKIQLV